MDNFPVLFTGKELKGTPITWERFGATMERMVLQRERTQRQQAAQTAKDEQWMLKAGDIDYPTAISDLNQYELAKELDEWNTAMGQAFQESKGKGGLPYGTKSYFQSWRKAIEAKGKRGEEEHAAYLQDKDVIQKDRYIGKYDAEKFRAAEERYLNAGRYEYSALYPKALNFRAGIKKSGLESKTTKTIEIVDEVSGKRITKEVKIEGTREESDELYEDYMLDDAGGGKMAGLVDEWRALTPEEQKVYMDAADENNDGIYEPMEMENALTNLGKDIMWEEIRKEKIGIREEPIPSETDKGKKPDYENKAGAVEIDKGYKKFISIPKTTPQNVVIPRETGDVRTDSKIKVGKVSVQDHIRKKMLGQSRPMTVTGYIADTDEFVFRAPHDSPDYEYFKGAVLIIKRDRLTADWGEKTVWWNGKVTKIKDINYSQSKTESIVKVKSYEEIAKQYYKTEGLPIWKPK